MMLANVLAAEGAIGFADFKSIVDTVTSQISVTTVVGVIGGIIAVCAGFAFFWWGIRKVIKMVMSALKKGKMAV